MPKLNKVPEMTELLKIREAAEALTLAEKTMWAWIASRRIGVVRLGRCVRIPRSEVLRLIEEGMTPPLGARERM